MAKSRKKAVDDLSPIENLAVTVEQAVRSAKAFVTGTLPEVSPGLEVEGIGPIAVPLKRGAAKSLIGACHLAPYGKGTETHVDTRVRKTYELEPDKFHLSAEWEAAIGEATRTVAETLGLPPDRLEAKLYKLLVYEKGGFFLPHRDSEKLDRMVASLIVVLPNPFEGGMLIIRHGAVEKKLRFEAAAVGKTACFAAFYADCEHEVERVTYGVRLALAYNLVLKPLTGKAGAGAELSDPMERLTGAISSWVKQQPRRPLVFALEHHYTQHGLSRDLLKGADRQLAELIIPAAEQVNCLASFAQVTRHLSQFADDGSFGDWYSGRYQESRRSKLTIGETYEDDLAGEEWAELDGEKQPWGKIAFDLSAIVSTIPIQQWKPTQEEYEGYTGNAGNTLDRWYHRSAIVVWHRDHHYEVIASAGAETSIPLFCSMVKKLAKTPRKRADAARHECILFARGIVNHWPRRYWDRKEPLYDEFPKSLLLLHDADAVAAFLRKLAGWDLVLSLESFVVAVCGEFGIRRFAEELKQLLGAATEGDEQCDLGVRDAEWLAALCCSPSGGEAGELCEVAVRRFCEARSQQGYSWRREELSVAERALPWLLRALIASGQDKGLSQVVGFVREHSEEFNLDDCVVPALITLVPWSRKRVGAVPAAVAGWLEAVREQLQRATATRPTPPADWGRAANVTCNCAQCGQLNAFLADRTQEVGRIAANESVRQHVISRIERHECDVAHTLERKGRPFALVLTKTTGSYVREVKRFEADCRLLKKLPASR